MPLRPGEMSLHHVCLIHSSLPNHSPDRRIGFSVACMAPHIRQTTKAKATAMLLRGEDRYGNYVLDEKPATVIDDPESIARHEKAVSLYRAKAEECGNPMPGGWDNPNPDYGSTPPSPASSASLWRDHRPG